VNSACSRTCFCSLTKARGWLRRRHGIDAQFRDRRLGIGREHREGHVFFRIERFRPDSDFREANIF
jgi:hypothetical protein